MFLKLQASLASSLRESLHTAMVAVVTTIELDRANAGCCCLLGNRLTDLRSGLAVSAMSNRGTQAFVSCAGTDQRLAGDVVDQLAAEMIQRAMHAKAWLLRRTSQLVANVVASSEPLLLNLLVLVHLKTDRCKIDVEMLSGKCTNLTCDRRRWVAAGLLGGRLARLDLDVFALVANTFALVWFRFAE